MQYYDPEKAARVWGRVQGNTDTVSGRCKNDKIRDKKLNDYGSTSDYGTVNVGKRIDAPLEIIEKSTASFICFYIFIKSRANGSNQDTDNNTYDQREKRDYQGVLKAVDEPLPHIAVNEVQYELILHFLKKFFHLYFPFYTKHGCCRECNTRVIVVFNQLALGMYFSMILAMVPSSVSSASALLI